MGQSGGKAAARLAKPSDDDDAAAGEDRLSALPDDILLLVLLRLDTAAAGRTSVLSRRWRRLWALLPALSFPFAPSPRLIASALAAHEAAILHLFVGTLGASPDSVAACLANAAPRAYGCVVFRNGVPEGNADDDEEEEEEAGEGGAFELPCLEHADAVCLDLGLLGLAVPLAGVFARLTELSLIAVRLHGPCELGDVVSSPRCPCLQRLVVHCASGLGNLSIHSESLIFLNLDDLYGLRRLTIVAPALKQLRLHSCFAQDQRIADILAPELELLYWRDAYDPSSVQLGKMEQVKKLATNYFLVFGHHNCRHNRDSLRLLQRFQAVDYLAMMLVYRRGTDNIEYLMDDITFLPRTTRLGLMICNEGHSFGAGVFHVLRLCTGIQSLFLVRQSNLEASLAQSSCQSGCICDQPANWKTEELSLNCLEEVKIIDLSGAEHEVAFLKRLFHCATVLKKMTITCDRSISESNARELCQTLSSFSRPETVVEFYM
ncbi:hypothetical protein ACP70R_015142 [Stipagrostis hirtigluma subsp. patula]